MCITIYNIMCKIHGHFMKLFKNKHSDIHSITNYNHQQHQQLKTTCLKLVEHKTLLRLHSGFLG